MTQGDQDDTTVRAAFADLRLADEREAPPFEKVVTRRPRITSFVLRPAPLAIAAAAVIVAVAFYQTLSHRQRFTVPREIVALSTWRAPTDMLLEASTQTLLIQTPQLGASTIDIPGDLP